MRKLFTLIAFTALIATVSAQTKNNYSIGLRVGANASAFNYFPLDDLRPGINAGLSGVWSKSENHGFGGDILYSRTGGEYFIQRTPERLDRVLAYTDYVRFQPKYFYFFRTQEDNFRPKITAGLSLGILTGAQADLNETDVTNNFKAIDFGPVLGVGFNYTIAKAVWLSFDIEYLLAVTPANEVAVYYPSRIYTNNLSANIGVNFGLTRLENE